MPDWKQEITGRLAGLNLEPTRENEIIEELSQDLEDRYAELLSSGATSEAAHLAALAELNDSDVLSRELRRVERHARRETIVPGTRKRTNMFSDINQDLRYGGRMLARNKGFTLVAALSLAIGIGANTAIFSLLNALLLTALPVQQPSQLVVVNTASSLRPGQASSLLSYPVFREMREKSTVFSGMFARAGFQMSLSAEGQSERVSVEEVSGNFFSLLGVHPEIGRLLSEQDDQTPGASAVAVLNFNCWQRRFSKDPQIIGKTIRLNDYPFTVVGVSPESFGGVEVFSAPDVRIPILMAEQVTPVSGPSVFEDRGRMWFSVMARLKPGISVEHAQAATDNDYQIARQPDLRRVAGDTTDTRFFKSLGIQLDSAKYGASNLTRQFSRPLLVLMSLVSVVLLIACLNIANLLLARASKRQKEIAVRLALGAGRFRLVRQLLTECLLLSALGGLSGVLFARWGTNLLLSFLPQGRTLEVKPDLGVLGFTLSITLITGLLFGLAPSLRATRPNLIPALKNEIIAIPVVGKRWELSHVLIVLQVALSLVLLVGAGLFVRTLHNLKMVDMGYRTDQIVTMALNPAQNGYKIERLRSFYDQLSERISALPGVKLATVTRNVPMSGSYSRIGIDVPGYSSRPGEEMAVLLNQIGPKFFATFGTTLLRGREFTVQDKPESTKVVIVNDSLARRFFAAESPLGKRISLENYTDLEIVGVVADAKYRNLKEAAPQTAYIPYSQYPQMGQRIVCIRTSTDPMTLVSAIRQEVRNLDPNVPVYNVKTFADQVDESVTMERLVALLSSFFGLFALLLASLGLYGVMAYGVGRRTNEIGIRMALGAQRRDVVWLVMREAFLLVTFGVGIGLAVALATARLVSAFLFDLSPSDPLTLTVATLVMIGAALLAGYLPARRAARVDPLTALRCE